MRYLLIALGLASPLLAQGPGRLPPWEAKAFQLITPPEGALKHLQIPWHTDLTSALKEARAEKRPMLLWVAGDPPLERC
jgi:hypothetical protein